MSDKTADKTQYYFDIKNKYLAIHTTKREDSINTLFKNLLKEDLRPLVIIGTAYIEEICKECFLNSISASSRKKFTNAHGRELTFSFITNILWAQNYISDDIYDMLNHLRSVRNKMAHKAILEQHDDQFIESKSTEINSILNKGWVTRNAEEIEKLNDLNATFFIAIENLFFGLLGLSMWIIPEQKLAKLTFIDGQKFLKVYVDMESFDHRTLGYFKKKYES